MSVYFLNCFTRTTHIPTLCRAGALCLLVETRQGLVLVDTGLGEADYIHPPAILRAFQIVTDLPMDPQETALRQVVSLGYAPTDVRHIVLTHMHFDHCGGLPDFPWARVHVHRRELEAFKGPPKRWTDLAYARRHVAHGPEFVVYEERGDRWFDQPAIRLPFEPEMWLLPLHGHTRGHCGVAIRLENSWLFHAGDAVPVSLNQYVPSWIERIALGPHAQRLREFAAAHPEIQTTAGHIEVDFF